MIVKKMFGFLIDDKFISDEEFVLEFEKLQTENAKLVDAFKLFAFPEGKLEHEDVERVSRQVLKDLGEVK